MSDVTEEVVQTEAEELASMMAGYNARGSNNEPPADTTEQPEVEAEAAPVIDDEPTVAQRLEALKAEVKAMSASSDSVRKLHGEIGNINRTIQQMQVAPKSVAPVTDEVAEALASAESIANEYPEIGAPMVRALKAIASRNIPQAVAQTSPAELDERVSAKVRELRQNDAIEILSEDHPDYMTVRDTSDYKSWLASKTPEYQERFTNTWNPAVVSKGLTEFKLTLVAKQKKQDRLAAAVTPKGVPTTGGLSTIPDDQGAENGYFKKRLRN